MVDDSKKSLAPCISVLGTGSDVGKSIVVTALCRIFRNQGVDVAPFKAQNMSNNSYVSPEGGEVGRAQAVQAEAACVELHTDMNPVLLKPSRDTEAQVVLHGKPLGKSTAQEYFSNTNDLREEAEGSLHRLREQHELIVIEGAGSCAELNLRNQDFVNFHMAYVSKAAVILVADIDRGGVFAQIIGTLEILSPEDRALVKGIIINRFRGDARLFDDGIRLIEERTHLPVLGLIPYFYDIEIDSEDGLPLDILIDPKEEMLSVKINIAVIRLPHISNFTDFSPLCREPQVVLHYLAKPKSLDGYDAVFLPGTKNTRGDLHWLNDTGWADKLLAYEKDGGHIGGICGGYQLLGNSIDDPHGVEGEPGSNAGLGLLSIETTLQKTKSVHRSEGIVLNGQYPVSGYEIHMGESQVSTGCAPFMQLHTRDSQSIHSQDGVLSANGQVWGTYLHGLFDSSPYRHAFLQNLRPELVFEECADEDFRDAQYNLLADHFKSHLDMDQLSAILDSNLKVVSCD